MKIPSYIICDARTNEIVCERCGKREPLPLPMAINDFVKWSNGFALMHRLCPKPVDANGSFPSAADVPNNPCPPSI